MAGQKLFINSSNTQLNVTLFIRASDNPANNAGTQNFQLGPNQQQWISYGNNVDIYLNGIGLVAYTNGAVVASQEFVIVRGSPLDNQLNMNNAVNFILTGFAFSIHTYNT